jgi:PAS domain S-box-containing protein
MNNLSTPKKIAIAAALVVLGCAGYYLALPIAYCVAFIFGSIFSIIAIELLGKWGGGEVHGTMLTESVQAEKMQREIANSLEAQTQVILEINELLEQRVAERTADLMEERQILADVIEATNTGTWKWNIQTRETVFNNLSAEIIGYTLKELSPCTIESWKEYVHPDDLKISKELMKKHFSGELPFYELEMRMKHKNGAWVWICSRGKLTRWTEDGKPLLMQGTYQNITKRKLADDELHHAKDMADAASLAKSEFLATMSHEIRTPMNGVIGMTGILLDSELTDEQRGYAEIVKKSGDNLLCLINDILGFSKIEARKLDMEMIDFDLRVMLEDTADMLAGRAGDGGLELICRIEPDVPTFLKGDPGRLRQIITNLAGNAIKFTHAGEVVISAALKSDQDGYAQILFEIIDTGIGIPQSRCAAVFDPFTQVDGSTTRKYGGTGLGLAICKQLAELMGGEIGVKSEEGTGSTFWFTAKFEKQTDAETHRTASLLADISGARILVAEDNDTNRKLMAALLKNWGCRFETVGGGEDALKLLHEAAEQHDPFRVALLGRVLPGMDGLEVGRRIKSEPGLESTLMVMVTSLAQRGDASELEQIGFVGYLPKPVRQSQLHDCISLVLGRADQTNSSQVPSGIVTRHTVAEAAQRGLRILLAEDNVINQKVAQSILGKLGCRADVVANGLEAVRALEMINYDIVLMDCQMPEMDGFQAAAMIRTPESKVLNHAVPIIAMTANAMKGDRELCIEAGMDDYLTKPVKKDELAVLLEKWVRDTSH